MKPRLLKVNINGKVIAFHGIPKNGGSTVRAYMFIAAGIQPDDAYFNIELGRKFKEDPQLRIKHDKIRTAQHNIIKAPQDALADYTFCVIRNPYKRFVSTYTNRIVYHKMSNITFDEFVEKRARYKGDIAFHIAPQCSFIGTSHNIYDYVFTNNQIDSHIKPWLEHLSGIEIPSLRKQTGGSNLKDKYILSDAQKKIVYERYNDDFVYWWDNEEVRKPWLPQQ